jgi:threonine 3-dehydrogenase
MIGIAKIKPEKGVDLKEFPKPAAAEKNVVIEVKIAGLCGSDQALYKLNKPTADPSLKLPVIIGHEFCGVVTATGPSVAHLKVGDRVAGETHIPCTQCYTCQSGKAHICPNMKNVGRNVDGALASYISLPEISVRRAPDGLHDHEVAMLEPLGVAVHAVRQNDVVGENVLVLGCGPLGLMTIGVAKAFGALRVLATSRSPEKLQKGLEMGADQVFQASDLHVVEKIRAAAGFRGVATAIDMSGSAGAIKQGLDALGPGGTLVLAGIPEQEIQLDVLSYSIYKEIKLLGIYGRTLWETWELSEWLFERGKINTQPLMGNTYPAEDYENAFQEAFSGKFGRTFIAFA